MSKKTVRDIDLKSQRILTRADFNVPLDKSQKITDDRRIRQFLPTLKYIVDHGGRAVLMSHLGRPKGDPEKDKEFSLKPVAARISELLGKPCGFVTNCIGPDADAAVAKLKDGDVLLLENL
ncbi:MAG: phosphoglycerate kinase, partial [Deltaproteobacteria bacterium]|nr:phosphoglycerate kinase [Deltaproteobacteria bacterium]